MYKERERMKESLKIVLCRLLKYRDEVREKIGEFERQKN